MAEFAVVAFGGLLHAGLVGLELVLGGERHAVDALEHGVRLRTLPIRGGGALQLECLDIAGVRQVRSTAEIRPHHIALTVEIVVHAQLLMADIYGRLGLERIFLVFDELNLVRLISLFAQGLLFAHHSALEALRRLDDALHVLFDGLQVIRREWILHVEVVVETVLDHRANAELGIRAYLLHGLCHDMGGRMAHDAYAFRRVEGHGFDVVAIVQRRVEVSQLAIETHCDDALVVCEQFDAGLACFHLLRLAVDCDGDVCFCHEVSFAIWVRGTRCRPGLCSVTT